MVDVSVIIPTLNEADNVDSLLSGILKYSSHTTINIEIIIVDDGSTDGTGGCVQNWQSDYPVSFLTLDGERGLASAIAAGLKVAKGDIVVVMDVDLSHPPEAIQKLIEPIMAGTYDMVIGSLYAPGGSTPGWSLPRLVCSRLVTLLVWPLTYVHDPMSGFFAVRRKCFADVQKDVAGFNNGLDFLVAGGASLRVAEIPIEFCHRKRSKSKLGPRVILDYLRQLVAFAGGNVSIMSGIRFTLAGLLGLVTDLAIFHILLSKGVTLGVAHVMSFFVASVITYVLDARWSFAKEHGTIFHASARQYMAFLIVALMALFLRGGILAMLIQLWGWSTQAAILAAVCAAATVNYLGSAFFIFHQKSDGLRPEVRWRVLALGVVAYTLVLRLAYLGTVELLYEEAYYWNYAQHLDIGYLDHPPMVAWIIWLGTTVLGNTEFAVRIGAFVCWLVAAIFSFGLTRNLFDKSTAFRAILLLGVLPFFFGIGLVMTPDAPLVVCWAGALYFLERALIGERRLAWWGVGACIGLGMLSKYTIALLGPATLLFLLVDRRSRRWLSAPEPYAAVIVAILLFSPVIVWNAEHDWASFIFQGPRRLQRTFEFSLHLLIGNVLLWLTPTGVMAVILTILSKRANRAEHNQALDVFMERGYKFAIVFSLFPLAVFFIFSLTRAVKPNWTGPLWLVMVPFMAYHVAPGVNLQPRRLLVFVQRVWPTTIVTTMLIYGTALHYLVLGLPGLPYPEKFSLLGWQDLGRQIEQIEEDIERRTGAEPLVVGMDKNKIASELAFYHTKAKKDPKERIEGILHTGGRHLFMGDSLMYRYWFPVQEQENRNMILVSRRLNDLTNAHVLFHVRKRGKINEMIVRKNRMPVGRYYYSFVEGYRSREMVGVRPQHLPQVE